MYIHIDAFKIIYIYTPPYIHTYIHTCMHACIHRYIDGYMDTCIHAYIYLFCTLQVLQEVVNNTRLYVYKQLLRAHLEHIPSSPLSHAKEGEVSHSWCLQGMDGEGQRYVLPKWIGDVLEVQVCLFVSEHSKWEKRYQRSQLKENH